MKLTKVLALLLKMAQQAIFPGDKSFTETLPELYSVASKSKYIYRYRTVLTNSVGEKQITLSPVYDNPYKMFIHLLQSYRFLEQRVFADLALLRHPTSDSLLDQIKLRIAIGQARELVNQICCEPDFPAELTEGFTLIDFTPEPASIPLRGVFMEILVKYDPEYHRNPFAMISYGRNSQSKTREEQRYLTQQNFTPVEYKFINRYLRSMPQFPMV